MKPTKIAHCHPINYFTGRTSLGSVLVDQLTFGNLICRQAQMPSIIIGMQFCNHGILCHFFPAAET